MLLMRYAVSSLGAKDTDLLQLVLAALVATHRIPAEAPRIGLPDYYHRDNLLDFYLEQKGGKWVGNSGFQNVPSGEPDVIGTPEARPFNTATEAFLAGASILCDIVTGSPELPFFLAGDKLMCAAWR